MLLLGTTVGSLTPVPPSLRTRGYRVLTVDDTEAQRYVVRRTLEAAGYEVAEAETGAQAIAMAMSGNFDAVVLDVHLPDSDGFEVGRRLASLLRRRVPIVHLSAERVAPRDRVEGLTNGAHAYLTHPFDPEELTATIAALIRVAGADQREQSHLATNSLLREALDALGDHIALLDSEGVIVAVNQAWQDFADSNGYRGGGTGLGANYPLLCETVRGSNGEEAPAVAVGIRDVLAGRRTEYVAEYPCHAPSEQRWFEMTVRRVSHPGVGRIAAIVAHRNVTEARLAALEAEAERRRAEREHQARAREDALFRALTEQSLEFVAILREDGAFRYVGPSVIRALGYQPEELLGRYPTEFVHEADRATMVETYRALRDGPPGHTAEMIVRLRHRDGSWRYFEGGGCNLLEHPAIRGITSVSRDVTGRVEEHEQLAAVFRHAPAFLAIVRGPDHRVERANAAVERLVGRPDLVGLSVVEVLGEDRTQRFVQSLDRVRRTGETIVRRAVPFDRGQGDDGASRIRYLDVIYQRLFEPDGDHRIVIHGLDLTHQVETVNALRAAEARLQDLFAKIPVPTILWEVAPHGFVLVDFNEAAAGYFEGRDAVGQTSSALLPKYDALFDEARRCLIDGSVIRTTINFEPPGGGTRVLDLTMGPQPPDRLLVHAIDVTEERRLTDALRQSQKMEAVGQLAGGIAHDFNNLLTVIEAHSTFLLDGLDAASPARRDAEAIQQAGDRAAALTRQLLAFSRKQIVAPIVIDLNRSVQQVHRLLGRVIPENIRVAFELAPDVDSLLIDPGQLEQVIVNLVVNARDAMPRGGVVTIATENIVVGPGRHIPEFIQPGKYVRLSVTDTGLGMDSETQARVFEPFFTTKEPGKGTGMGLSTVYGIAKQAGGYVTVASALGAGAHFDVFFPSAGKRRPEHRSRETTRPLQAQVGPLATILVAEDDAAVRDIIRRTLVAGGYEVLVAADGPAAVRLAETYRGAIDLILSDAIMPGMSGVQVIEGIRARHPAVRALLVSGYTNDEITRGGIEAANIAFLAKPFIPSALIQRVRDILKS